MFLILIAVALFAALSYAVTQSGRGSGTVDREKASLAAAAIVSYAGQVQQTITRMHVLGGVNDQSFCFDSPQWPVNDDFRYDEQETCTDESTQVFGANGGSLPFQTPSPDWYDTGAEAWIASAPTHLASYGNWVYTGSFVVQDIGTAEAELVLYLGPIRQDICVEINKRLGLPTSPVPADYIGGGTHSAIHFGAFGTFTPDNYSAGTEIGADDGTPTALAGHATGCGRNGVSVPGYSIYYFYHVLLQR